MTVLRELVPRAPKGARFALKYRLKTIVCSGARISFHS